MQHLSIETIGFSKEREALRGGLRGGYYGGYFEYHVIRDKSYGVWTDARYQFFRAQTACHENRLETWITTPVLADLNTMT